MALTVDGCFDGGNPQEPSAIASLAADRVRVGPWSEDGDANYKFNPRTQVWADHFRWSEDGLRVVGLTATGRATVVALHLDNDPDALTVRANWVSVVRHPGEDA